MACWVARYYLQRSEGKEELVIDDYKMYQTAALRTRHLYHNYKPITSSRRRQFYYEWPRPLMSLFKVKYIKMKKVLFAEQMAAVNTNKQERGTSYQFLSLSLSILPLLCYNWIPTEKGIIWMLNCLLLNYSFSFQDLLDSESIGWLRWKDLINNKRSHSKIKCF